MKVHVAQVSVPIHAFLNDHVKVYLDGQLINNAISFCTDTNTIVRHKKDENNRFIHENGELVQETVHGMVKIVIENPNLVFSND
jgi:hypothetical protein